MTIAEMLWLFFGGVIGVVVAGAIPFGAAIVERVRQVATRRPEQALWRSIDRDRP
jgi:uncharacterized membrane protein YesL